MVTPLHFQSQMPDEEETALRAELLGRVAGSGVLNSVKVGLKRGILRLGSDSLRRHAPGASPVPSPPCQAHLRAKLYAELRGSKTLASALPAPPPPSLHEHVLNCLVSEYLATRSFRYTLSVFVAESGTQALPSLGRADLLRLAGVAPGSEVERLVDAASARGSLAGGMLAALARLSAEGAAAAAADVGCQTVSVAPGGKLALVARLEGIEAEYHAKSAALEAKGAASLEQRVAAFQRECEERHRLAFERKLQAVREGELAAARAEEARKYAAELERERAKLAAQHAEALARVRSQEEELLERGRRQRRELDVEQEVMAQRLRAEEERLRDWKAGSEAALAARRAEADRAAEALAHQQRLAAAAQQEVERRLEARQAELQRREEEASCQRAAMEAERGSLATLRQRVATLANEATDAREQLHAAEAAHTREQRSLQKQVDALHQRCAKVQQVQAAQVEAEAHAQAGSAACLASLTPAEVAKLQRAVRRLMQQQQGLLAELQASRERERVWRGVSAASDRLLQRAAGWQEAALRQCEDLRLVLACGQQEAAELQQAAELAVGLAGGDTSGAAPAWLQPLRSAAHGAGQWCAGALRQLEAARQQEERLRTQLAKLRAASAEQHSGAARLLQQQLAGRAPSSMLPGVGAVVGGLLDSDRQVADLSSPGSSLVTPSSPAASASLPDCDAGAEGANASRASESVPHPRPPSTGSSSSSSGHGREAAAVQQLPPQVQQVQQQQQQQQQVHSGQVPALVHRTTSDILAAYRARQQANGASAAPVLHASPLVAATRSEATESDGASGSDVRDAAGDVVLGVEGADGSQFGMAFAAVGLRHEGSADCDAQAGPSFSASGSLSGDDSDRF